MRKCANVLLPRVRLCVRGWRCFKSRHGADRSHALETNWTYPSSRIERSSAIESLEMLGLDEESVMDWVIALVALIWGTPIFVIFVTMIGCMLSRSCRDWINESMFGPAGARASAAGRCDEDEGPMDQRALP